MITFRRVASTCRVCGRKFNQIDTDAAHAEQVVTNAVIEHLRNEHGIEVPE